MVLYELAFEIVVDVIVVMVILWGFGFFDKEKPKKKGGGK